MTEFDIDLDSMSEEDQTLFIAAGLLAHDLVFSKNRPTEDANVPATCPGDFLDRLRTRLDDEGRPFWFYDVERAAQEGQWQAIVEQVPDEALDVLGREDRCQVLAWYALGLVHTGQGERAIAIVREHLDASEGRVKAQFLIARGLARLVVDTEAKVDARNGPWNATFTALERDLNEAEGLDKENGWYRGARAAFTDNFQHLSPEEWMGVVRSGLDGLPAGSFSQIPGDLLESESH